VRELADRERIERFMVALGDAATSNVRVYLVGGTTAVLMEPELYRFPAIDPPSFREAVENAFR